MHIWYKRIKQKQFLKEAFIMGAFDFENNKVGLSAECRNSCSNEECIIAQKL